MSTNPVTGHKLQSGEKDFCLHLEKWNKVSEPFKKEEKSLDCRSSSSWTPQASATK